MQIWTFGSPTDEKEKEKKKKKKTHQPIYDNVYIWNY